MARRRLALALLALMATVVGVGMPSFSTAAFTSRSSATASVSAAPDWTPPKVTLGNPGSPLSNTVTLTADATDGETGIQNVVLQSLASGGTAWVTICTVSTAPYSCSWNTKLGADGTYDLRAVATDKAGYTTVSDAVRTTVANTLMVVLTSPGDVVRGTVPLTTTIYNAGTVTYTVRVEYAVAGTSTWKSICTNLSSPYTCSWATTGATSGEYYDLRSVAVSGSSTVYSAVVPDVLVDNAAPTVTMTDPGSPLSGTRTFAATASDGQSGIATVRIQYAQSGSSTYTDLCSISIDPFSCRFDTTKLVDGTYSFRAIATDVAGNSTTSAVVGSRVVDNTVSSVSMEDPGAYLSGTTTLTATAGSTAGVQSVRIQRAASGTIAWTDVCTATASPYTCSWNTTTVADGLYDLRAVLLDGTGKTTVSSVVASRRVDNTPLRAFDIQATNGGLTAGKVDSGDIVTYTYNEQVDPASISPGWTGSSLAVTVRLRDGNLLGLGNKGDSIDVLRSGATVNLGSVNLKEEFIRSSKTATFNATMSAASTTVNGAAATRITITVGALASGSGLRTTSTAASMVWSPSASVTAVSGSAASTAPVTETGTVDRDF